MLKNLDEMRRIQIEVAQRIILKDLFKKPIISVAGIDIAFLNDLAITACVILDYDSLEVKTKKTYVVRLNFPYIPTFLGFREGPPILDIINTLNLKPEIFLINAQGIAHPSMCGCTSYVGVLANVPTIGVTARKLCGNFSHKPEKVGDFMSIYYNEKVVGWVLKSKEGCRPIFISPGHLVSLKSSLDIAMKCMKNHKLPEPIYQAHITANEEKRKISQ